MKDTLENEQKMLLDQFWLISRYAQDERADYSEVAQLTEQMVNIYNALWRTQPTVLGKIIDSVIASEQ
jgi:hypothetical protein